MENAKHDASKHDATKYDATKYDKGAAAKPPETTAAAAQPEEKELTQAEKDQILREAVSWYLRNDFRDAQIRKVCEEFIAGVDKAARAAVESGAKK